jgi:hypothetical protein
MRILSNVQIVRPGLHQETRHKLSGSMAGISRCEELCRHCDPFTAAQILSQACVEAVRFEVASKNVNASEVCHTLACRVVARGVGMRNFEGGPPSPRLRRESSLSTYDASEATGGKGIRTPGLLIANETLYQLSYTPE